MSLLVFILLFLAAYGLGETLVRRLGCQAALGRAFAPPVPALICWVIGVGCLGLLGLLGSLAGLLPRPVAVVVLLALAAWGAVRIARTGRGFALAGFSPRSPVDLAGAAAVAALLLWHVRVAWSPHLQFDSYAYHVTMPRQYLIQGRFFDVPYDIHAHLHALWEMAAYFGYAFSLVDLITPKLMQVAALLGATLALQSEVRRLGHPGAGWVVAAWWMLMQEAIEFAPTAQIEIALAFEILLGFLLLVRALDTGRHDRLRLLILAGIVFGFANGTKNSAMVYSAIGATLATAILFSHFIRVKRRHPIIHVWKPLLCQLTLPAAAGLLLTLPWLLKNLVFTGNPFYPFLLDVFPPHIENAQVARDFLLSYGNFEATKPSGIEWLLNFLGQVHFRIRQAPVVDQFRIFTGFLLVCCVWMLRRTDRDFFRRFLLFAALTMTPLVVLTPGRRFVLGVIALYLLLIGDTLGWLFARASARHRRLAWVAAIGLLLYFLPGQLQRTRIQMHGLHTSDGRFDPHPALVPSDFVRYFRTRDDYEWGRLIERHTGSNGKVLSTENMYMNAWIGVPMLSVPNIHGEKIIGLLAREGLSAEEIAARLRGYGITHVFTRGSFDEPRELAHFRNEWLDEAETRNGYALYVLRDAPVSSSVP
ncbi:MAG: hypothetical protein PWP23_1903 [Candidatus Sumerlaeota bacterium]|nr:hypothetical protein [Candidatus Sumerlaeota bacterium]